MNKNAQQKFDVIIVGAGVSGLVAAQKLHAAGLNVLILEARNRLGGRIHTDHSLGFPIDLGASWMHNLAHSPIAQQAKELAIEAVPLEPLFKNIKGHLIYGLAGEKLDEQAVVKVAKYTKQFFTQLQEFNNADLDMFAKNFYLDNFTIEENKNFKNWLLNLLSCWSGAEFVKTSILAWQTFEDDTVQAYVMNGYDHLINFLAKDINIEKNSVVKKINYSAREIRLTTDNKTYVADKVIITVPIGVLQNNQIEFMPELPKSKMTAINNIGIGVLNKIILHFPSCFWEKEALTINHLVSQADQPGIYINGYYTYKQPLLMAFVGGEFAKQVETFNNQQLSAMFLIPLQKMYGNKFIEPIKITVTKWFSDPYSLCSYSYLARGNSVDDFIELGKSVANKLFFAGEASHAEMFATVHGAYLSGERVTNEILFL